MPPPCAVPTQPRTVVGWDARLRSPSISSSRTPGSMAELGYKSPSPGALALVPSPCHHLGGRPQPTQAKGEEGETPKPLWERRPPEPRATPLSTSPTRFGIALHGYRSYMASNRHGTTIHSSTPPTVSPPLRSLSAAEPHRRPWRSTPGARRPVPCLRPLGTHAPRAQPQPCRDYPAGAP